MKKNRLSPLYLLTIIVSIAGLIYGSYYGIFLYKSSFNISIVVVESLFFAVSSWLGYLYGIKLVGRKGFAFSFKASFFIQFLTAALTFILIERIQILYPYFAVLRGFPAGIFTAAMTLYFLKNSRRAQRGKYFFTTQSIDLAVGIIIPISIGLLIAVSNGYKITFLISGSLYLAGSLLPLRLEESVIGKVSPRRLQNLMLTDHFREYGINKILTEALDSLNGLIFAIVPFLILKSEFAVGTFGSLIAVFACIASFVSRNITPKSQQKMSFLGSYGRFFGNLLLIFFWTTPALLIRGLLVTLFSVYTDPFTKKLSINNIDHLSERKAEDNIIEVNILDSTLTFMGKLIGAASFIILLYTTRDNGLVFKNLLFVYGVWKLINLSWQIKIHRRLSQYQSVPPGRIELPSNP